MLLRMKVIGSREKIKCIKIRYKRIYKIFNNNKLINLDELRISLVNSKKNEYN